MRSFLMSTARSALALISASALGLSLLPQSTAADAALAGTFIRNVAEVSYFNTSLGIMERVLSNPVQVEVASVPGLEVTGYSDLLLTRGAFGRYHFDVVNSGNVRLFTSLSIDEENQSPLMSHQTLYPDLNGNGQIDGEDIAADMSAPFLLAVGERLQLIYDFRISAETPVSTRFSSILTAVGVADDGRSLTGQAMGISRVEEGGLEIAKGQVISENEEGAIITYTLRMRNDSERDAFGYPEIDGQPIVIDGAPQTGVLLRDAIPLNTTFDAIQSAGGMTALVHMRGAPVHTYRSAVPAGLADDVDAVAFFHEGDFAVGHASAPSFSVRVPMALGAVEVHNTASAFYNNQENTLLLDSNTVVYERETDTPGTLVFEHPETGADQPYGTPGSDTRLRVTAGMCNGTTEIDSTPVTVRSVLTNDVETLIATETGANTGVFLTPVLPMAQMSPAVAGDQVMATDFGDTFIATALCENEVLEDDLMINPGNFLFNSVTNAPIDDVVIAVVNARSGAEVARTQTDQRGFFTFFDIPEGDYRYAVMDAPAWIFPSARTDFVGMGRNVIDAGYGEEFSHAGGALFVSDIPVDPHYGTPLALDKTTNLDSVGHGEFVTYTLSFTNNMHQALIGGEILDRPAYGVNIVPGSVTLNGAPLDDPQQIGNGDLRFDVGMLEPLSRHELSYVMLFSAAAREGRNENAAILSGRQAGTGTLRQSQTSRAMVRLDNSGGVFARQGTVLGAVFMDCNGNGLRDRASDEPGIPGVRIVTQEGLFVVTDIDGAYSLNGMRPVTHAFLVQPETLPAGTEVQVTRTNDLRRGGSRLVPLKKGELRTENFAVAQCTPEAFDEVSKRRDHFDGKRQSPGMNATDLPIDGQRSSTRSVRSEAGIATTTQLTPGMIAAQSEEAGANATSVAQSARASAQRQSLDSMIRNLDSAAGFVDFAEHTSVSRATQNIRVKGKADLTLALLVNGRELGADRVGERTNWEKNNVQALEYVAVKLRSGENVLTLVGRDGFGIERVRKELRLTAPGKPARIEILLPDTAAANPASVVPVVVRVLDAGGRPVPASGTVTLSARRSLWDVTDIRSSTPGVQAYLDNGEATFNLIPPQASGPDLITVRSSFGEAEATLTFTPDLNERVLIGVIEGAVSLSGDAGNVLEQDRFSSFEDTTTGVRGELYLKGVIRGDALLTLRYSSDRDTEDRLFRDIRGEEYYPVYGDNSERGADAQSSSNLFVKVEKGRSYVLYGDIAIEPEASALKLGGLQRVATGAKGHWENDRVSVTVFAARTAQEQQVQEIRGRGVSGPYDLDLGGYVQGSERVEILVRDEDGGDILSAAPLLRGTDYLLDFFRNTITFDSPVRQFDLDGNPVSIRVTYEVEAEGSEAYWLYGGEVNYALSERTSIGARAVHADAPLGNTARQRMHSAYLQHEDRQGGVWEAEVARSENAMGEKDTAARLSYELKTETRHFAFEAIRTGRDFYAQGGLARAGTSQVRLSYGAEIDQRSDIAFGAEYTRDRINNREQLTVDAIYSRRLSKTLRGGIGLEYRYDRNDGTNESDTALILGAHWTPAARPGTVIEAKLRAPLNGDTPTELTLGLYDEPKNGWRVYNEIELQFGSDELVTRAAYGFTYTLNEWVTGRTEMTKASGTSDTNMVQGLSVDWDLNQSTNLRADLEHARNLDTEEGELTSFAIGTSWESADGDWVGDAELETTWEDVGKTHYASIGIAGNVTPDLTILARSRAALDRRNGENFRQMRTRIGAAYRPKDNARLDVLAWYEHRLEEKHSSTETHMWSIDANYELDADLRINGKYAGQYQKVGTAAGTSSNATTQLVQGGLNYEFGNDRFQLGLNATHLWDSEGNSSNGIGAEFGFTPREGVLLALGYNKARGRVAGQSSLYDEGFYFRFNLLLDNSLWTQFDQFLGS
ncbi:MAG: hypothetical protein ABJN05_04195 [Sulfitobacter dubius]